MHILAILPRNVLCCKLRITPVTGKGPLPDHRVKLRAKVSQLPDPVPWAQWNPVKGWIEETLRNAWWQKVCKVKDMVFPVVVYRCENQARKKSECWRIYAFKLWWLEKTVQSPLDCKIKPVNPKGNQPWRFTGRTDAEALKLWPICKELTLIRKDWEGLKAKGEGGNRMKWLDSITDSVNMNLSKLGDCGGQRSLACYSLRGCKEWDTT